MTSRMTIEIAGYLAGIIGLITFVPYITSTLKGRAKPERASWLIWAIVDVIAFFSQSAKGAGYSLFMTAAFALGDFTIFLLAFKYGYGKRLLKRDVVALIGAALSLMLWYITKEAAF